MKKFLKIFSVVMTFVVALTLLVGCKTTKKTTTEFKEVDYVSELKLDMTTTSKKATATVDHYVDGDTTHFFIESGKIEGDYLKARYLAINTPESTGQVEEWGKKASNFTKSKLQNAVSIIVESDDEKWNKDSTGGRMLVWVWYKTDENSDYRNLNLEILQNGLALASNSGKNRYGETCVAALNQAQTLKLNVYSGEKDPDFYYGEAQNVSLKELRTNPQKYVLTNVAFEANVTRRYGDAIYVEDLDEESGYMFGMYVYLGYALSGAGLEIVSVGNRVLFVGSFQYYETGGNYQLTNLKYQVMRPNDPSNIRLVSEGHEAAYTLTTVDQLTSKVSLELTEVDPETKEEKKVTKQFDYAEIALATTVKVQNLKITSIYTTNKEDSSSKGAMTFTCTCGGKTFEVRTVVLYDADGNLVTADRFEGKTINVKGLVEYYKGTNSGNYQIKVLSLNDIEILD